jgi:RNA polymerase sigma factor (sigma-70 family)
MEPPRRTVTVVMTPFHEQASDGELLQAFVGRRDEAAFAQLEHRHGASVLCACRRTLGRTPDAEDAAQLAFISLAAKAPALVGETSVAAWLHHVAWCACIDLKRQSATRARHEREAMATSIPAHRDDHDGESARIAAEFDAALASVPEKFRLPVILHHLQDHGHDEGARAMGCKVGTFASRLSRGRDMLRDALRKRGVALSLAALGAFLARQATASDLPPPLPLADPAAMARLFAERPLPSGMDAMIQGSGSGNAGAWIAAASVLVVGAGVLVALLLPASSPPRAASAVEAAPVTGDGPLPPRPAAPAAERPPSAAPVGTDRPAPALADAPVAPAVLVVPAREPETTTTDYVFAGIHEPSGLPALRSGEGLLTIGAPDAAKLTLDGRPARFADLTPGETVRVRWLATPPGRRFVSLSVVRPKATAPERTGPLDF